MSEERKKILEMLDDGKISVEEAEELLSTVEDTAEAGSGESTLVESSEEASALRIIVVEDGAEEVNISIPIQLVKMLENLIPVKAKDKLADKGISIKKLIQQIEKGSFDGKLVDIKDGKSHVEIKLVK